MPEADLYHGRFLNFEKTNDGDLVILLNNNGHRVFEEIENIRDRLGIDAAFRILIRDFLRRQWGEIKPKEIGALTSSLIITDEFQRDSRGKLVEVGSVYWNQRYQVDDEIAELRAAGQVLFKGVE